MVTNIIQDEHGSFYLIEFTPLYGRVSRLTEQAPEYKSWRLSIRIGAGIQLTLQLLRAERDDRVLSRCHSGRDESCDEGEEYADDNERHTSGCRQDRLQSRDLGQPYKDPVYRYQQQQARVKPLF